MGININDLTVGQCKEIAAMLGRCGSGEREQKPTSSLWSKHLTPGKRVFVRSVTHHYCGEVVECDDAVCVLRSASWIASDGRFSRALTAGELDEVEPYPADCEVLIGLGAVIDVCEWRHDLPREVK